MYFADAAKRAELYLEGYQAGLADGLKQSKLKNQSIKQYLLNLRTNESENNKPTTRGKKSVKTVPVKPVNSRKRISKTCSL